MSSPNSKIIIAIDGFSSSGKSSFAKALAAKLGYVFIDTGAMYRAVTLYGIENGAVKDGDVDEIKLEALLPEIKISFGFNPVRGASDIYLNERDVEKDIRRIEVNELVSKVSSIPAVRKKLVAMQQDMGRDKGIVMDGRDIGTVVFPEAELKIFMTADVATRARRRYDELLAEGHKVSLRQIEKNLQERDRADQTRQISPLRKADDALVLDNSHMTPPEQMDWVMSKLEKIFEAKNN